MQWKNNLICSESDILSRFQTIIIFMSTRGRKVFYILLTGALTSTTVTAALATAQMPPEQMAQQAHQLAGGCATFGVLRLRAVLSGVETDIKTGNVDAARAAAASLPALWGQTSDALQTELRWLGAPQQPPST